MYSRVLGPSNSMLGCGPTTPKDYPEWNGFARRRERECGSPVAAAAGSIRLITQVRNGQDDDRQAGCNGRRRTQSGGHARRRRVGGALWMEGKGPNRPRDVLGALHAHVFKHEIVPMA